MQKIPISIRKILEIVINVCANYLSYFFLTITILGLSFPVVFAAIDPATGGLPVPIRAILNFFNTNVAGHYSFNLGDIFHALGILTFILWGLGTLARLIFKKTTDRVFQSNYFTVFLIQSALIFSIIIVAFIHFKTAPFANPNQHANTQNFLATGSFIAYISFCMRALVIANTRKKILR